MWIGCMPRFPRAGRSFSYHRPIKRGERERLVFVIQTAMSLSLPQNHRAQMQPNDTGAGAQPGSFDGSERGLGVHIVKQTHRIKLGVLLCIAAALSAGCG